MTLTLASPFFQLSIHPDTGRWEVASPQGVLTLKDIRFSAAYRVNGQHLTALESWPASLDGRGPETSPSPHGALQQLRLEFPPEPCGLRFSLVFSLPEAHPLLLWRLIVENRGPAPAYLGQLTLFDAALLEGPGATRAFFSNGWQSWNYTGTYAAHERFKRSHLGPITAPPRVNAGTPHPHRPGLFGSDFFGALGDRQSRTALLVGFLSQKQHFGSLEARLNSTPARLRLWANGDDARLDPGQFIATDWACLQFVNVDDPDPLGPYLDAVGRENAVRPPTRVPTGWCSWYHFYQKVSAEDVRANLKAAQALKNDIPLEMIQLDDGFEAQVGDWFHFNARFPDGVAPLAAEIRSAGFTPGLWLAPFIVHPKSRLYAQHPDWLLRGRFNRPVNAGFIWDVFTTALDLTHPAALQYACDVVRTAAQEWGFDFLKLDFLYAAALPGHYRDATQTRAQVLRRGLEALRQAAGPQTTLLGCGCPLGPALGLVDAMRIGCDVAPNWEPTYFNGVQRPFRSEPDFPSARNAVQNALTRAPLHRRWWVNDPDCVLLRPDSHLTLAEVQTLATVTALTDGALLFSDDLPALPPERLRIAAQLLPLLGRTPRVLDWFDAARPTRLRMDVDSSAGGAAGSHSWHLLAAFNWADQARDISLRVQDFGLPALEYQAREFWRGDWHQFGQQALVLKDVPPHGAALLAARPVVEGKAQYLGSDLHVSQGLEVAEWAETSTTLAFRLERPGRADGQVFLSLPHFPRQAFLNGAPLPLHAEGGHYRLEVAFQRTAWIKLEW